MQQFTNRSGMDSSMKVLTIFHWYGGEGDVSHWSPLQLPSILYLTKSINLQRKKNHIEKSILNRLVGLRALMNITAWKLAFSTACSKSDQQSQSGKKKKEATNFHLLFVRKLAVSQVRLIHIL